MSDDRAIPLLVAQANKRGAFDWNHDDVGPVIADLLARNDALISAIEFQLGAMEECKRSATNINSSVVLAAKKACAAIKDITP